jgi:hypothetical protein
MGKLCILTGLEEPAIKKMCLNCTHSWYDVETDTYSCKNEEVMTIGAEKVKDAAKTLGFDIDTLVLRPMNLKAPTKKCDKYVPNIQAIKDYVEVMLNTK